MKAKTRVILDSVLETAAKRTVERGLKHHDFYLPEEIKDTLIEAFLRNAWEAIEETFSFDEDE